MEATVQDVEMRKVTKRDGSGDMTLYDVVIADGSKWTAFEKELAERAYALKGTPALLEVSVEVKGQYTNRNLRQIQAKPTSGFTPALGAMEAQLGNGGGTTTAPPSFFTEEAKPVFSPSPPLVEEPSYKDRNIWRQTASKVSARISKTESEFWGNLDLLVRYYETGEKPFSSSDSNPPPYVDSDVPVDEFGSVPF